MSATLVLNQSENNLVIANRKHFVIPNRAEGWVRNLFLFPNGTSAAKISE